jgi:hypothetical protein
MHSPISFLWRRFCEAYRVHWNDTTRFCSNITVRTFPEGKQRNRAIAILGLVGSVSFSLGVVIGEFLSALMLQGLVQI